MFDGPETLNLMMGASTSLLGAAFTVMALVPLVMDSIGSRYTKHFAAQQKRKIIRRAIIFLFLATAVLFLNVMLITVSSAFGFFEIFVKSFSVILFMIALLGFGASALVFGKLLWAVWNE